MDSYAINTNLFDPLRLNIRVSRVASVERILALTLWNFVEIWLCFGIIASAESACLSVPPPAAADWRDAYYFSAITQLTIGYGDISPVGILRVAAPIQGFSGFLLGVIVLARFVAVLPRIQETSVPTRLRSIADGSDSAG